MRLANLAGTLLGVTATLSNAAFPAETTRPRPTSDAALARVLSGCWGAEWFLTFMDGSEESGLDRVCFWPDGTVLTDSMPYPHAGGTYQLSDRTLHLQSASGDGKWLFEATALSCDAAATQDGWLKLSKCREDSTGRDLSEMSFHALDEESSENAGDD